MRSLIFFIVRHHFFLLFLCLEVIAIILIVQYNKPQQARFEVISNNMYSRLYLATNSVTEYFNLRTINAQLAEENARLRESIETAFFDNSISPQKKVNSQYEQQYTFITAQVLHSTINKPHNYMTLNRGRKHGVRENMGVISPQGVVGIVVSVSQHYSKVLTILSPQYKVSARFLKNNFYGSVYWNGLNYRSAVLAEIPAHAPVLVGDTIVTNSFSNIYPADIPIGVISNVYKTDYDNFYNIDIKLSTDFKNIEYVYVVQNLFKVEREILESIE